MPMSYVQVENPALTVFSRKTASLSSFYGCKSSKKHCFEIIVFFFLWENAVVYHLFMDSCIYKISKKNNALAFGYFPWERAAVNHHLMDSSIYNCKVRRKQNFEFTVFVFEKC